MLTIVAYVIVATAPTPRNQRYDAVNATKVSVLDVEQSIVSEPLLKYPPIMNFTNSL